MIELMSLNEMTFDERQEMMTTVAKALEESSVEASVEGHRAYVENSKSLVFAIQSLAHDMKAEQLDAASVLLQQAMMMILVFRQRNIYPAGAFLH